MTGAYLRVQRNGEWLNVEVEHLTKEERVDLFQGRDVPELLRWLDLTCEKLAELEVLFDTLVADGVIEKAP